MELKPNSKEGQREGKEAFQRFRAMASALIRVPKAEIDAQAKKNAKRAARRKP